MTDPTSTTFANAAACEGAGVEPLPPLTAAAPRWRPRTVGARAGISMPGELFFESADDIDHQLDVAAATGARWLRADVDWTYAEPDRGSFSWCRTDRVIVGARRRGLDVLAVVAFTPRWARDSPELHGAPKDPQEFARFATEAVRRYAPIGVHAWEVWNEPNVDAFWHPRPDPAAYARLVAAAGPAIHAADPSATVVTAGLAPAADADDGHVVSPLTFVRRFYEHADRTTFDAVATHPYSFPGTPTGTEDWNQFGHVEEIHAVMAAHGDGDKALWLTEYGAPTGLGKAAVSEPVQSDLVTQAYARAGSLPWAGPLFWYTVRDLGTDDLDLLENFGLVRYDYTEKAAFATFTREMATASP